MAAAFYRNWKVLILIKATHFSSEDAFIGFKDIAGSIISTLKWIFLVDLIQFIKVGQNSLFTSHKLFKNTLIQIAIEFLNFHETMNISQQNWKIIFLEFNEIFLDVNHHSLSILNFLSIIYANETCKVYNKACNCLQECFYCFNDLFCLNKSKWIAWLIFVAVQMLR